MSKRKLLQLVQRGARERLGRSAHADDRGLAPARLYPGGDPDFCERIGVAKPEQHHRVCACSNFASGRSEQTAPRVMAVFDPLKVSIDNYPEDAVEEL